jgi:hypothetical protein
MGDDSHTLATSTVVIKRHPGSGVGAEFAVAGGISIQTLRTARFSGKPGIFASLS